MDTMDTMVGEREGYNILTQFETIVQGTIKKIAEEIH